MSRSNTARSQQISHRSSYLEVSDPAFSLWQGCSPSPGHNHVQQIERLKEPELGVNSIRRVVQLTCTWSTITPSRPSPFAGLSLELDHFVYWQIATHLFSDSIIIIQEYSIIRLANIATRQDLVALRLPMQFSFNDRENIDMRAII